MSCPLISLCLSFDHCPSVFDAVNELGVVCDDERSRLTRITALYQDVALFLLLPVTPLLLLFAVCLPYIFLLLHFCPLLYPSHSLCLSVSLQAVLFDIINKNYDKIKKPRGDGKALIY